MARRVYDRPELLTASGHPKTTLVEAWRLAYRRASAIGYGQADAWDYAERVTLRHAGLPAE